MAKIKVFTTKQTGLTEINESVSTWGQLLPILQQIGLYEGDMKAIVRETQMEFSSSSSALPTGLGFDDSNVQTYDFTLFLSARKTKSGSTNS